MGWRDYLARLLGKETKNERELSTLSPIQEQYVKGSLEKMLSFEKGGLNYELNNRALGQEPNYKGAISMSVGFFYDTNTGEMIHFGHHPTLRTDDVYHDGNLRVAGEKTGNRIVEIYTQPNTEGAKEVIAESVRRYNKTKL